MRNACVIPGNPAYRFQTGEFKHELIICGISGLLCFTFQPLFANGFWTTYNRAFGTVQHVHRENNNTEYYTICEYSYIENAQLHQGEAFVIESKENELVLFKENQIFTLNSDNPQLKINHTKPRISTTKKQFTQQQFFNIEIDSLKKIMNQQLCSGLIQSNYNIQYVENAITYYTNFIQFKHKYNFQISPTTDTLKNSSTTQLRKLYAAQLENQHKFQKQQNQWQKQQNQITQLQQTLNNDTLPLYDKDKAQKQLIKLQQTQKEQPIYEPDLKIIAEIENIEKTLSERHLLFSGYLTIYHFINEQNITQNETH
jgi:inner membrane protein